MGNKFETAAQRSRGLWQFSNWALYAGNELIRPVSITNIEV
jgi:hypothetical protein